MSDRPAQLAVMASTCASLREQTEALAGGLDAHRIWLTLDGTDIHIWVQGDAGAIVHEASRNCPCGPAVTEVEPESGGDGAVAAHRVAR